MSPLQTDKSAHFPGRHPHLYQPPPTPLPELLKKWKSISIFFWQYLLFIFDEFKFRFVCLFQCKLHLPLYFCTVSLSFFVTCCRVINGSNSGWCSAETIYRGVHKSCQRGSINPRRKYVDTTLCWDINHKTRCHITASWRKHLQHQQQKHLWNQHNLKQQQQQISRGIYWDTLIRKQGVS